MQWLNKVAEDITAAHPVGEIIIESGSSPSGAYHLGHLRELLVCDAILLELKRRGRQAKHIAYVDDLDALRKIPVNIPAEYEKYLGQSLCDIPAPGTPELSYSEYFLKGFIEASKELAMEVEFVRSHQKYRAGFFVPGIEKALERADSAKKVLETVSGHKLGQEWSPIQINEGGYLKKRRFVSLDKQAKTITYEDRDGAKQTTGYAKGEVKLDWRIDWPARWWLMGINVEPFGRDHATKGGSYDTGAAIVRQVYGAEPPLPVPYDFVNMAGDTKKMSASKGTGLDAVGAVKALPPEIIRFFMLRSPASKRLYFDPQDGVSQLIDEFAELLAKENKTDDDKQIIAVCTNNLQATVSNIPFSHLVASYQAALKDPAKTLEVLSRTEYHGAVSKQSDIIKKELAFIDNWLSKWAPEEVKFQLLDKINAAEFSDSEKVYLKSLADKIAAAPADADGEWFHKAIYDIKEADKLTPGQVFEPLYKALIGKKSGPRAGWFLSMLDRDWLVKRLTLEN